MSSVTRYKCDRCQREITEERTNLPTVTGLLRDHFPGGIDLCTRCAKALFNWIRENRELGPVEKEAKREGQRELGPVERVAKRVDKNP
jgi:DNA-directed RNA polymerase subunit RPC12/RpoP